MSIKSSDSNLLKRIENILDSKIMPTASDLWRKSGYVLNEDRQIESLSICGFGRSKVKKVLSLVKDLPALKHLFLHDNRLNRLSELENFNLLISLQVGYNEIVDISPGGSTRSSGRANQLYKKKCCRPKMSQKL